MSAPALSHSAPARQALVLVAGNPNSGKSTLFNALSGSRTRVANYPGVTIDRRSATLELGGGSVELTDLPGTYSLSARSAEEQIAVESLLGRGVKRPDAILVVVDATALSRALYLTLEILEIGCPVVIALNMTDEATRSGVTVRADELAEVADFFSFGTNDLTQLTFGFSRDDVESRMMPAYLEAGLLKRNPFESIDQTGVGELVIMAAQRGRKTKKNLKMGVCGEHGGDPESIGLFYRAGLDYVSCSPYRVPIARLSAAQAVIGGTRGDTK